MERYINLLFSGGLDSTIALLNYVNIGESIRAVTFDYGQRHREEINSATAIEIALGIPWRRIVIPPGMLGHTSQLIGEGGTSLDTVQGAFVPFRNAFFLLMAANRAYVTGKREGDIFLAVGSTASDHLPDQRQKFFRAMETALTHSLDDRGVIIAAPNIHNTKSEMIKIAYRYTRWRHGINLDHIVSLTHTCYEGWVPPCGKCHSCVERAEAFEEAGVVDPLIQ